jgi:hypothetical protein
VAKQTWNIKGVLDILSALAVVISIIFVGVQMSENTKATRSAIAADTTALITAWYDDLAENTTLFRAFIADPESLTSDQQYQMIMKFHGLMLIMQNSFYLKEQGTLDESLHRSFIEPLNAVSSQKGVRFYWEKRKGIFVNQDFIAYVEKVLASEGKHSSGLYDLDK